MGIAGVATFSGTSDIHLLDNVQLKIGDSTDLALYHNSSGNSWMYNGTNGGDLYIGANAGEIYINTGSSANDTAIKVNSDSSVDLYYDNSKKFETTNDGTVTTGIATANSGFSLTAGGSERFNVAHVSGGDVLVKNPTSAYLAFGTNNTERIRIESGGDVGIGTVNAQKRLHVADYGAHGAIRVEGSGNGNRSGIEFYRETSAGVSKGGAAIWVESDTSSSAGKLRFGTASNAAVQSQNTAMILDNSGQLGIGTDNPSALLHVEKDGTSETLARFESNMGTNNNRALSLISPTSDSSSEPFTFVTGNSIQFKCDTHVVTIDDDANVGIGTVTPDQTLELWKASGTNLLKVTSEANSTIGIEIEKTGSTTQSWRIADGQNANGKLEIYDVTDSRSVMAFDGTGKVGVGTLSPGMQFHINGSVTNDVLKISANGSGQMVNLRNHGNVPNIVRFQNSAGNAFWDAQYNTDDSFSLDHSDSTKLSIDSDGGMELTPSKNSGNNGFTVTPAGGTTASSFQILSNNNAGADGRNGCATFIDVNYYATGSTIFSLAGRGTNLLQVLGNGNVEIGGVAVSQSRTVNIGSNSEANLAIETHNDSTSESSNIRLYKSGNTGASPQIVEANDYIGQIMAYGHDGTDYANQAAGIRFKVDGTPGSNNMPGALQLQTNNGTGGIANRFNISATGNIGWMGDTTASSAVQQRKRYSTISHSANTTYDVTLCSDFGNNDMLKLEYAYSWNDGDGGAWGTAIVWKHHDGNHDIRYLGEEIASPPSSFSLVVSGNDVLARIVYGGSGMNGYRLLNVECVGGCSPAEF